MLTNALSANDQFPSFILAASFTAFLQEGFVLCCRLWISFSRFTQSCTFLFAVFPGSFLIFLAFSKLLLCKIFLVTVADFNLTRKRITDKIEVDVDLLLTVDRPPARRMRNESPLFLPVRTAFHLSAFHSPCISESV